MTDRDYMRRAVELAWKGCGWTNPNPMVGAVVVKDGRIIGEGFHHKYGDLHAERDALKNCTENPAGAVMYVTLEPCCHCGKQPPCVHAIVESGIAEVVIGSKDPNPLVSGRGIEYLRENGVKVTENFMKEECDKVNPIFFHYITTGTPYVSLKYAATADGKTAVKSGKSKWITGPESRAYVHGLRNQYMGILAGINTVAADDPLLNCRIPGARDPVRIICDSRLRISGDCQIVRTAGEIKTIIVTASIDSSLEEKRSRLEGKGIEVLDIPADSGRVDLKVLMQILGGRGIDSVLIEGGGTISFSALESGIVNHIYAFIAPKIFGGAEGRTPVGGRGIDEVEDCFSLTFTGSRQFGQDILLEYDL